MNFDLFRQNYELKEVLGRISILRKMELSQQWGKLSVETLVKHLQLKSI